MNRENRELYRRLLVVALPVMLQSLIQSGVGFLDTLMIGQLGETEVAAVGSAGQLFFFLHVFFFGIASGTSIFLSQYYGGKKIEEMKNMTAFAVVIALAVGTLGAVAALFFPSSVISIFSSDENVISAGTAYLSIVGLSYPFSGFALAYSGAFRSMGDAKTPMLAATISLLTNALLNAVLIFGLGPLPAFGVSGGAAATLISRIEEALILLIVSIKKDVPFLPKGKSYFKWSRPFLSSVSKTTLPVILHEGLWVTGSILYKVAYSSLGTGTLAAVNIDLSIADMFFVAANGLASGAGVVIGNILGEGDKKKGFDWGRKIMRIAIAAGLVMAFSEALLSPLLLRLYNLSPAVREEARLGILANSVIQIFDMAAIVFLIGILRSGGDSRTSMRIELIPMYVLSLPLTFIGAILLKLPLWALFLLKGAEILPKFILGIKRIENGKWVNVI